MAHTRSRDLSAGARQLLILAALVQVACAKQVHELVPTADPEHSRIRFLDGSVSVNDRCPVTGSRLNPRMDPVLVNGRSIGFC